MGIPLAELSKIVGKDNIIQDPERLSGYFLTKGLRLSDLVAVTPSETEEVQRLVRLCYQSRVALFSTYDTHFPAEIASRTGVLVDFRRMDRIERIDSKNLCVHIQRGVTFEQLDRALEPEGLTVLYPAASATRSVVCHAVSRGMFLAAAKYPEVQVTNMQVVLQNGAIHRTGSHANSEEMADWKEDGGPNLSKWYLGGDDIFGIVVRGSMWVYPRFQGRRFGAFGFGDQQRALKLLKELPRKELPQECLVMNRPAMVRALAVVDGELPVWTLVTGVEGFPELADYQHRKIREAVDREGGVPLGATAIAGMEKHLQRPGYLPTDRRTTAFHCLFGRVAEFDALLGSSCGQAGLSDESVGKTYIAHGLGRSVWCKYDFPPSFNGSSFREGLESKLASAGAFFDRPQGQLAEQIYGTIPAYVRHVKKIKDLMDDRRILNPGKPVKEI